MGALGVGVPFPYNLPARSTAAPQKQYNHRPPKHKTFLAEFRENRAARSDPSGPSLPIFASVGPENLVLDVLEGLALLGQLPDCRLRPVSRPIPKGHVMGILRTILAFLRALFSTHAMPESGSETRRAVWFRRQAFGGVTLSPQPDPVDLRESRRPCFQYRILSSPRWPPRYLDMGAKAASRRHRLDRRLPAGDSKDPVSCTPTTVSIEGCGKNQCWCSAPQNERQRHVRHSPLAYHYFSITSEDPSMAR